MEEGATQTETMPNSARWTPLDGFNGTEYVPAASDVWSFGVVLFYAATQGFHPWQEGDLHVRFDFYRFQNATLHPPDSPRFSDLPDALSRLIRRCLDPNPAARPPMYSVAAELEALIDDLGVFSGTDSPTQDVRVPLLGTLAERKSASQTSPGQNRTPHAASPIFQILIVGAVVAVLAAILVVFRPQTPPAGEHPAAVPAADASQEAVTSSPQETTGPASASAVPDPVYGIGPWTASEVYAMENVVGSNTGDTFFWGRSALSQGRNYTNAHMIVAGVTGAEHVISRPSFVIALQAITNSSTQSMTFDLNDCDKPQSISQTESGPMLVYNGPENSEGTGWYRKDLPTSHVALPSCGPTTWPGPITVPAGGTWTADKDYQIVFEVGPGSDPGAFSSIGLLLKSTEGDVAFEQAAAGKQVAGLILPASAPCGCEH